MGKIPETDATVANSCVYFIQETYTDVILLCAKRELQTARWWRKPLWYTVSAVPSLTQHARYVMTDIIPQYQSYSYLQHERQSTEDPRLFYVYSDTETNADNTMLCHKNYSKAKNVWYCIPLNSTYISPLPSQVACWSSDIRLVTFESQPWTAQLFLRWSDLYEIWHTWWITDRYPWYNHPCKFCGRSVERWGLISPFPIGLSGRSYNTLTTM